MNTFQLDRDYLDRYLPAERERAWHSGRRNVLEGINALLNAAANRKGPDYVSQIIAANNLDVYHSELKGWSSGTLRQIFYAKDKTTVTNLRQRIIDLTIMLIAAFPERSFSLLLNNNDELVWMQDDVGFYVSEALERSSYSEPEQLAHDARYYISYYWRHGAQKRLEKVGCALVSISADSWNGAQLTFYYSNQLKDDIEVGLRMKESVPPRTENNILYLRLEDEPHNERPAALTQINMNVGRSSTRRLMIGSYVSTHREPGTPTAGLMLWQRVDSWEAGDARIRKVLTDPEALEPAIFHFLAGRRVDTIRRDIADITQLPFVGHIQTLPYFVNRYQGYYVNPKRDVIVLFRCVIDKLGRVTYESMRANHKMHASYGIVRMIEESIRIDFDYRQDYDSYRLQYNLPKSFRQIGAHQYWLGYYGGLDDRLESPIGGKVVLRLVSTIEETEVDDYSRTGFRQHHPQLAETVLTLLDERIMYGQELKPKTLATQADLSDFEGVYTCYVAGRSEYQSTILPYRLTINADATAFLERSGLKAAGVASVQQGRYLSIQLNEERGNDFTGTLLFSLEHTNSVVEKREEINHLYGLLSKIRALDRVEASAALLITERFEDRDREWKEEYDREQDRTKFELLDKILGGGLSFLSGQIYRQIRLPLKANRPFRPRKEEYRRLAFYAACHLARQIDAHRAGSDAYERAIQQVQDHLKEAYIVGFAAQEFSGQAVGETDLTIDTLRGQFARYGFENDNELQYLRRDLRSLIADQQILAQAKAEDGPLNHPELRWLLTKYWPHIGFPIEHKKPETT